MTNPTRHSSLRSFPSARSSPAPTPLASARASDLLAACLDVALTASDRAVRAAKDHPELLRRVEQARRELLVARELLGVERGKAA